MFIVKPAGALERNKPNWTGTAGEYMAFRWRPHTAFKVQTRPRSLTSEGGLTLHSRISYAFIWNLIPDEYGIINIK